MACLAGMSESLRRSRLNVLCVWRETEHAVLGECGFQNDSIWRRIEEVGQFLKRLPLIRILVFNRVYKSLFDSIFTLPIHIYTLLPPYLKLHSFLHTTSF